MPAHNIELLYQEERESLEGYDFFNEDGAPITLAEWSKLQENSHKYHKDVVVNNYRVISYWVGVDAPTSLEVLADHPNFSSWKPNDPPLIFNNVLLDPDERTLEHIRTATKAEAYVLYKTWADKYKGDNQ